MAKQSKENFDEQCANLKIEGSTQHVLTLALTNANEPNFINPNPTRSGTTYANPIAEICLPGR